MNGVRPRASGLEFLGFFEGERAAAGIPDSLKIQPLRRQVSTVRITILGQKVEIGVWCTIFGAPAILFCAIIAFLPTAMNYE
jgi:hypothetical protein